MVDAGELSDDADGDDRGTDAVNEADEYAFEIDHVIEVEPFGLAVGAVGCLGAGWREPDKG